MQDRQKRILELRRLLVSPNGLARIVELHKSVCGTDPRMDQSPYTVIEAIADCEYEKRTGQPYHCPT
jgi:hypothetical protein